MAGRLPNILINDAGGVFDPVLSDFGIAYAYAEEDDRLTNTTEAVGPRLYMAPELEGGKLDDLTPAADVYSLGKVLWWLMGKGDPPPREKHREDRWDLVQMTGDPRMALVNELLDRVLIEDFKARLPASSFREEVQALRRMFGAGMEPVSLKMRCRFCGRGTYGRVESTNLAAFGLSTVSKARWELWVCDRCGHAELFRRDLRWQQQDSVPPPVTADSPVKSNLDIRASDEVIRFDVQVPPNKTEIRIPVQFRNRELKGTSVTSIKGTMQISPPNGTVVVVPEYTILRAMDPAEGRLELPLTLAGRDAKNVKLLAYVPSEALISLRSIDSKSPIPVLVRLAITDFDDAERTADLSYTWRRG